MKSSKPWLLRRAHRCRASETGTTLVEVLAALTLTGLLAALFLPFVSQMLGRWTAGLGLAQVDDQLMRASIWLQADFARAVPLRLPLSADQRTRVAFSGGSDYCRFVETESTPSGMEVQTITYLIDHRSLERSAAPYDALTFNNDPHAEAHFMPIANGYSMRFAYVSKTGEKTDTWSDVDSPTRIELYLQPMNAHRPPPAPLVLVPVAHIASD